jgi:hypothetical protein
MADIASGGIASGGIVPGAICICICIGVVGSGPLAGVVAREAVQAPSAHRTVIDATRRSARRDTSC